MTLNNWLQVTMLLAVALAPGACVPHMQATQPAVEATVVNADDGQPLKTMQVGPGWTTDSAGALHIPAERHLGLALPVSGVYGIERSFTLSPPGYRPRRCTCTTLTIKPQCRGEISLLKENELAADDAQQPASEQHASERAEPDGRLTCEPLPAEAKASVAEVRLAKPTAKDLDAVISVLGKGFPTENGTYKTKLLVSNVDLNGDGGEDLVVVQKALCSNHACDFHFLVRDHDKWTELDTITSWAIPYILQREGQVADIVGFDHVTDDCSACSPPKPVLFRWHAGAGGKGRFVREKILSDPGDKYEPVWEWSNP